ncbi:MAG: hypothetical protein MI923_22560, partial [Phycisphaerales bacterium]|nr:hypothetical protein [Phycisphaerales bacterium]
MSEKMKVNKINRILGIVSIVFILLSVNVSAVPIPLGIDGRVYELDGVTEVFSGIPVTINDTTSGFVINTETGHGSSGRYSAAVNGEIGDVIVVTAYNPLFSTSRTVNLTGVIHDFDLILNMSLPDLPPEIRSTPITSVLEDDNYLYQVDAFDW